MTDLMFGSWSWSPYVHVKRFVSAALELIATHKGWLTFTYWHVIRPAVEQTSPCVFLTHHLIPEINIKLLWEIIFVIKITKGETQSSCWFCLSCGKLHRTDWSQQEAKCKQINQSFNQSSFLLSWLYIPFITEVFDSCPKDKVFTSAKFIIAIGSFIRESTWLYWKGKASSTFLIILFFYTMVHM